MRITILASASALALVVTVGYASADDKVTTPKQFSTLNGVKAVAMSSSELSTVKGMDHHFFVTPPGTDERVRHDTDQNHDASEKNFVEILRADGDTQAAAPGYRGLILHACGNGVISGPSTGWCP